MIPGMTDGSRSRHYLRQVRHPGDRGSGDRTEAWWLLMRLPGSMKIDLRVSKREGRIGCYVSGETRSCRKSDDDLASPLRQEGQGEECNQAEIYLEISNEEPGDDAGESPGDCYLAFG
ncbi:hypothetical protein MLD38_003412 [Melastoma candidum]|uniref:Uncharacterized protein n=1 Tax=Melastoma candidum TaxID=119954 RepID=A0ACB9S260_9MYRT|nr:hypothetical protein MLD38_003412 [Melastoma candidum]